VHADIDSPTTSLLVRGWRRFPIVVRATLVALLILNVGQGPPMLALLANLRVAASVPLFLPITALWLWLFWQYLSGRGWPRRTANQRHDDLRGGAPSQRVWLWSLVAGGLGLASALSLALLTGRIARLPGRAYEAPFDLSPYPWWTVLSFFLAIACIAGIVEEAAFRGYMLSQIQRRHGWLVGIALVAILFYIAHLSHAYATVTFVPFFAAYSIVHGALVFLARSILPSVVLHAIGDFCILPMQYGVIDLPLGTSFEPYLACALVFGLAAIPAFWRLRRLTQTEGA
jgi:membrane protease YdiL (CAAX protease family)